MSDTTDTEKLEMIRKQGLARQTRYYQAHKAEILAKKQKEREQLKELNKQNEPIILPLEYTLDMIQTVFTEHITNINTLKKYNGDMQRVFTVSNLEYWNGTIDTYNGIKESLDNCKYSLQTRRGAVQSVLVFIDKSGILIDPKITARYNVLYEVYGIKCSDANNAKKTSADNEVMDYNDYMKLIDTKYKTDSKQYLIASLYRECTMRDDYGNIRIITDLADDDDLNNFIFRNDEKCTIIMNSYKTSKIYGKQLYELTDGLNDTINNYIVNNNITDFLFPQQKKLSVYVTNMNKKVGVIGGINFIRHSLVSLFINRDDLTPEQRHNFAVRMGHNEGTQQYYRRGIKGVLDPSLQQYATDTIA
jgi:hypothetical protein